MFHTQSPYAPSNVPHYSSPGSHIDGGGASTSNQPSPALVPGPAPRNMLISSAHGTTTSDSNDQDILRADLQPSAVTWGGVPSPPAQGNVDDSATSFPNDSSSSRRYRAPVRPGIQLGGNQDASVAQTSEGSRFYRDTDNLSLEEATAPFVHGSSADVTTYMVTSSDSSADFHVPNGIRLKANCTIKPLRVSFNEGSCPRCFARRRRVLGVFQAHRLRPHRCPDTDFPHCAQ